MRARKRRSVLNTISAAMLEVSIMGLFVILAQPQLRDGLFELLSPDSVATSTQSTTAANLPGVKAATTDNQPVEVPSTQAADRPATHTTSAQLTSAQLTSAQSASHLLPAGELSLPSQPALWLGAGADNRVSHFAPLQQYESFRISVPSTSADSTSANPTYQTPVAPTYTYNPAAQGQPTQLAPNQWNVAVAGQSPSPPVNYNGWAPIHSAQTSYRDIYPPPYGTQSQWK